MVGRREKGGLHPAERERERERERENPRRLLPRPTLLRRWTGQRLRCSYCIVCLIREFISHCPGLPPSPSLPPSLSAALLQPARGDSWTRPEHSVGQHTLLRTYPTATTFSRSLSARNSAETLPAPYFVLLPPPRPLPLHQQQSKTLNSAAVRPTSPRSKSIGGELPRPCPCRQRIPGGVQQPGGACHPQIWLGWLLGGAADSIPRFSPPLARRALAARPTDRLSARCTTAALLLTGPAQKSKGPVLPPPPPPPPPPPLSTFFFFSSSEPLPPPPRPQHLPPRQRAARYLFEHFRAVSAQYEHDISTWHRALPTPPRDRPSPPLPTMDMPEQQHRQARS